MRTALAALLLLAAQESPIGVNVQTRDGNSLVGTIEITQITVNSSLGKTKLDLKDVTVIRSVDGDVVVSASDGSMLRGKCSVESWKVKTKLGEFTVKTEDIQQMFLQVRPAQPAPASVGPGPTPGGPRPNPTTPKPENPGLKPTKILKLNAAVSRTLRSVDGKKLYLLNTSDSKALVVDLETLMIDKEISLAGGETVLSLSPSGTLLAAGGKRTVTVASLPQSKVVRTFTIEMDIQDLCMVDDQTIVASTNSNIVEISISKQAVTGKANGSAPRLYLSKDGKRIHTNSGLILLPDKGMGRAELQTSYSSRTSGQDLGISPDGRFAAATHGMVYRLSRSFVADMLEVAKVEPHWSSAWVPSAKKMLLMAGSGFVKEYDTDSWEMARSWQLGWRLTDAVVNEGGTLLTGVGQPAPPNAGESMRPPGIPPGTWDLLQFEVPK